jgi:hypothetical protein
VLYQLSYTPKSNDLEPPSHRYVAKLLPRRRSLRRGALVIADRNALSSLAAPHFSPVWPSAVRPLRRVLSVFEIEPKQKSRSAFDVNKNFNFNGDVHSAELSGSLLCLPKSATSFSAGQR